jgi:putative phosphoribosyl transferase
MLLRLVAVFLEGEIFMVVFRDRLQAARELTNKLSVYRGEYPVVLGVPRGAVPMAEVIANGLGGDLDLILVHKFTLPRHPEFALGSVTEDGQIFLNPGADKYASSKADLVEAAEQAIEELKAKRLLYTSHRRAVDLAARTVILVDDGIATGATMLAAIRFVKERGARKIIVATAVASEGAVSRLQSEVDEVVALFVPEKFYSVSQFFEDFKEVDDANVMQALAGENLETLIHLTNTTLRGFLEVPVNAKGLVLFVHGSGSGRKSPRNQFVARVLQEANMATLLVDLLDESEENNRQLVFDIPFLADRLREIEDWIAEDPLLVQLPLGLFGASTGAAAALTAAAGDDSLVRAVVSRGGRPDLASDDLSQVKAPTLLIVGGEDEPVLNWNQRAFDKLNCIKQIVVIKGATHLFEESGALEQVAAHAQNWFDYHLSCEAQKSNRGQNRTSRKGPEILTNP